MREELDKLLAELDEIECEKILHIIMYKLIKFKDDTSK